MHQNTLKKLAFAKRQLKPIKRKTVSGKEVEIKIDSVSNISRVLEVSRQAVHRAFRKAKNEGVDN